MNYLLWKVIFVLGLLAFLFSSRRLLFDCLYGPVGDGHVDGGRAQTIEVKVTFEVYQES